MTGVNLHVDHFRTVTAFEPSTAGTAESTAMFLWKEQSDKLGCGECWQTAVVIIPIFTSIHAFG